MSMKELVQTAADLLAYDKGLLAIDESTRTCNKRFGEIGIPQTVAARRAYRELILTAPGLSESISGVILFDETIRQKAKDGTPILGLVLQAGIIPGIKVDEGTTGLAGHPGENVTEGLDGLGRRLAEYVQMGALFAKWRCAIVLDEVLPTQAAISANAQTLARYALMCQEAGILPIVEPEVVMEGMNSLQTSAEVTEQVLHTVFDEFYNQGVILEGMILKPNMVLPGLKNPDQGSVDHVAEATVRILRRSVPAAVPGIAFLSGGQPGERDSAILNAMNAKYRLKAPWALTFSFGRAIQHPALEIWGGKEKNLDAAQQALVHRARCDRAASAGQYNQSIEGTQ